MSEPKQEIEAFLRNIVARIVALERTGTTGPAEIAEALNKRGTTTRKGRSWNAATVRKFLASPGARRLRAELER